MCAGEVDVTPRMSSCSFFFGAACVFLCVCVCVYVYLFKETAGTLRCKLKYECSPAGSADMDTEPPGLSKLASASCVVATWGGA